MIRSKKIKVPPYEARLCLVECNDIEEVRAFMNRMDKGMGNHFFPENETNDDLFACAMKGNMKEKGLKRRCYFIVFNKENKFKELNEGVVAHECLHVLKYIYEYVGAEHSFDNPEPECYLIEFLVDECCRFLKMD